MCITLLSMYGIAYLYGTKINIITCCTIILPVCTCSCTDNVFTFHAHFSSVDTDICVLSGC